MKGRNTVQLFPLNVRIRTTRLILTCYKAREEVSFEAQANIIEATEQTVGPLTHVKKLIPAKLYNTVRSIQQS